MEKKSALRGAKEVKHSINWIKYLRLVQIKTQPKQDVREIWKGKEAGQ